jgi:hypothetical protein
LFVWIFNHCSIAGIGTEMHKKVDAEYQFTTIILQLQRKINCGIASQTPEKQANLRVLESKKTRGSKKDSHNRLRLPILEGDVP